MEVGLSETPTGLNPHFNGAIPIKRQRLDLTTTGQDEAQVRRRREAEKTYGRGRKISCE
jgi:U3 small nucleolar RNA-associated protein 7